MKQSLLILIMIIVFGYGVWGENTRPILDDIGYCWNPTQIERFMAFLKTINPASIEKNTPSLVAGISPHDDYLYAGRVYYQLFPRISAKEVVIFGVTHRTPRLKIGDPQNKLIFDDYENWQGPYGKINISPLREYLKKNLDTKWFITNNEAHNLEHSIEGMLPFLQYFNRDVRITPIMVTAMPFETMTELAGQLAPILSQYISENHLQIGKDIFFLISCDANHYGKDFDNTVFGDDKNAHDKGIEQDRYLTNEYLTQEISDTKIKGLTTALNEKILWCGKYSVPVGLLTVSRLVKLLFSSQNLTGNILLYTDTYSEGVLPVKETGMGITAPFSLKHWVGFFSAAFYVK